MNIGDLVCWHDKRALLGVVVKVSGNNHHTETNPFTACKVQWSNGVASVHSSRQLIKIEPSEDTNEKR